MGIGPYKRPRKTQYFPFCAVGVDAHIDPSSKMEIPPCGGGWALLYRVSFSRRRGGRPCPPAGIARTYGNPMRNRNILEGRCGHRPLQKTSQDFTILEGGQRRPPLQKTSQNAIFSVSRRRGRCPHRPTLQNGNTPARGRMDVIVLGFVFAS